MDEARKGFFGALLDLSFTTFVTTRVVKVLYVLTIVLLLIAYAGIAIAIFSGGEQVATLDEQMARSRQPTAALAADLLARRPRPADALPLHAALPRSTS